MVVPNMNELFEEIARLSRLRLAELIIILRRLIVEFEKILYLVVAIYQCVEPGTSEPAPVPGPPDLRNATNRNEVTPRPEVLADNVQDGEQSVPGLEGEPGPSYLGKALNSTELSQVLADYLQDAEQGIPGLKTEPGPSGTEPEPLGSATNPNPEDCEEFWLDNIQNAEQIIAGLEAKPGPSGLGNAINSSSEETEDCEEFWVDNIQNAEQIIAGLKAEPGPSDLGHSTNSSQEATQKCRFFRVDSIQEPNFKDADQSIPRLSAEPGPSDLANATSSTQKRTEDHKYFVMNNIEESGELPQVLLIGNKRRRTQASSCRVLPHVVDHIINSWAGQFSDMKVNITRQLSTEPFVHIQLHDTMAVVVVLRGLLIETVVIKDCKESLDIWTESSYPVFRRVTEHAQAAMLHFSSCPSAEVGLRAFLSWLHSYVNLFTEPCNRCGLVLRKFFPPTWRDFDTFKPFHYDCTL